MPSDTNPASSMTVYINHRLRAHKQHNCLTIAISVSDSEGFSHSSKSNRSACGNPTTIRRLLETFPRMAREEANIGMVIKRRQFFFVLKFQQADCHRQILAKIQISLKIMAFTIRCKYRFTWLLSGIDRKSISTLTYGLNMQLHVV